jgi:hypothetical protein
VADLRREAAGEEEGEGRESKEPGADEVGRPARRADEGEDPGAGAKPKARTVA